MQQINGNADVLRWLERRRATTSPSDYAQRQVASTSAAEALPVAAETTGPTSDSVLNEWLALHADQHLSSDTAWIFGEWPAGGTVADLEPGFREDIQALVAFSTTVGGQFDIQSYARSPEKQHIMHVAFRIRNGSVGYGSYKFSSWDGVAAAKALIGEARTLALTAITNPEVLNVVWDTGTHANAKAHATAIAGPSGYNIGYSDCANGGADYSWPTGKTSKSLHGTGRAVDVHLPASLPNEVTIAQAQAANWPGVAAVVAAFGKDNVKTPAAGDSTAVVTPAAAATLAAATSYTIKGLSAPATRDAFYELFFRVRSAARAGFVDLEHFQAP